MLEERKYRAVDKVFLIMCSIIDPFTGYAESPKIATLKTMHSSLMSTDMSA